jgi:cyclase
MNKKKRLSAVITVKDKIAVQSFSYKKYLPLGKPEILVENFDRWGVDEIIIQVIDQKNAGPDLELLDRISRKPVATPIIYSGGIFTTEHAKLAIKYGADRIVLGSLFFKNYREIIKISNVIGAQAVIISLPSIIIKNKIFFFDYLNNSFCDNKIINNINENFVAEIFLTDMISDGIKNSFNTNIIKKFNKLLNNFPLIVFGGISSVKKIESILNIKNVSAVAIGNFLTYKEHSYYNFLKIKKAEFFRKIFFKENIFYNDK